MTETTYLLPPAAYTSDEWFDRETEQLFEHTWAFVGVEHDVSEPGDYITAQVGRAPILVVRGKDRVLRAFHNICRHRGLPVVDNTGNRAKGFVCPYHRWNYGLDGALRSVPQREQFPEFDNEAMGLLPVECQTWKAMIFVHVQSDPEPLDTWMAGLGSALDGFSPETLTEISDQSHDVAANWKLYVENHVDWLHLWYLHSATLPMYDHADGERLEFGRHWASFESLDENALREFHSLAATGEQQSGLLPIKGLTPKEESNGAHFVFPALTLFTQFGYWMLGQIIRRDAINFTLRLRVFAMEGSDGGEFEKFLNPVMFEDYTAAQAIQRSLGSPAFGVGPLATNYEHEIMRFHEHYLEYVTPPA